MKRRLLTVLMLGGLLTLSACGGGSADSGGVASLQESGATATTAAAATGAALEKEVTDYVECLRKDGVDVPDPTVAADGTISFARPAGQIDRDALNKAMEKCGTPPQGVTGAGGGAQSDDPAFQDAALKWAKCMRDEGLDVPDPNFSAARTGTGGGGGLFGDLDQDDPKVKAATATCASIWTDAGIDRVPGGGGGGN